MAKKRMKSSLLKPWPLGAGFGDGWAYVVRDQHDQVSQGCCVMAPSV